MDIQDFFKSTLYMLLQIKNILFSLSFFITEKENHKREIAEKEGKIIPPLEWVHVRIPEQSNPLPLREVREQALL